ANTRYVQWRTQVSASSEMTWRVFYPGHSETPSSPVIAPAPSDCPIALPDIQPRTVWCPDGQCPPNTTDLKVTATTHFIVHHSASANESNDWAAVVRSFWDFHVNTRNWSDIGYNYLIDPNGVLYEGRGEDIQGAHYCGKNQHTMGICVIGNFTNVSPTAAALATLTELMAWKSCKSNIDPLGESFQEPYGELLHHIEGHRAGCSTSCPGDSFYPTFDALRTDVAALLQPITSSSDTDVANMIMQLSPNPSTGLVHILINKLLGTAVDIEIWRVDGQQCILRKQLRTGMGSLELSFDLSGHPPGVYWVVLRQDNHRIHQTIVLQ
ncbi:MAG: N-acetylmuramoyl-L-alanine amidase, partial [Bacteroidota bacterium]